MEARLWDMATGRPIGAPLAQEGGVRTAAFSPDGRYVLTGGGSGARLWDAATAKPIGPAMSQEGGVFTAAFSPDGRTILTMGGTGRRLWEVGELPDDLQRVTTWVEVMTGLTVDARGEVRLLNHEGWQEAVQRLERAGQSPMKPRWSLDPILFGPQPTARPPGIHRM